MKVEIVCTLLLVGVVTTYGLKCYVCDGTDSFVKDGDCGDSFVKNERSSMLKTCNSTDTYCKKVKAGANNVWTSVTRECASECEEENILYVHRTVCCNDVDGCNAADATAASLLLSLATAMVVSILQ